MKPFFRAVLALVMLGLAVALAPAASAQTAEVSGTRKVVSRVTPSYPSVARNLNLTGMVKLEVIVLSTGAVKSVKVLGGSPLLAQSAEAAVREWKWEKSDHETTEPVQVQFNQ